MSRRERCRGNEKERDVEIMRRRERERCRENEKEREM
jgi:hypothetical protein